MADVKICNLDLIAPVQKRELIIGGTHFEVEPLTVARFIEFMQVRQKIADDTSLEEGFKLMKEMVRSAIPSMSEELIESLPINQLQLVVSFINDEIPEEILSGEALKNNDKKEEKEGATAETDSGN